MTVPPGPLPHWMAPLSVPASFAYGAISDAVLARRLARAQPLPRPTLSVGNLSAGGTGKSPIVRWIAAQLLQAGCRPVIVTRGYRRIPGGVGDETQEHRDALPSVDVIEGVDRRAAVASFLASGGACDCVVLDDAFQRRDISRELDLVVVRADDFTGHRLPRGWLRERPVALRRASILACWADEAELVRDGLQRIDCQREVLVLRRAWSGFRVSTGGIDAEQPLHHGSGLHAEIWLGVGRPDEFLAMAEGIGVPIGNVVRRRDHARYTANWVERQCARLHERSVHAVLTSEKDWVKVRSVAAACASATAVSFVRPVLGVEAEEPQAVQRLLGPFTADVLGRRG